MSSANDKVEDWEVKTAEDGRPFYFNKRTKKSFWVKPDVLKKLEAKQATPNPPTSTPAPQQINHPIAAPQPVVQAPPTASASEWVSQVTNTGRPFYFNAALNKRVWVKPPELLEEEEKKNAEAANSLPHAEKEQENKEPEQKESSHGDDEKKDDDEDDNGDGKGIKFSLNLDSILEDQDDVVEDEDEGEAPGKNEVSFEDGKKIFLQLMKDKNISGSMKWSQVHDTLKKEERYKVLSRISDRKKVWQAYTNQLKKTERAQARTKLEQSRADYKQMLSEYKNINSDTKYLNIANHIFNDPRYRAIDMKEREPLFQDYLDELFEKEKEEARLQRKEMVNRMKEHFPDNTLITPSTKYHEACEILKYNPVWGKLHDLDRLDAFSEYILGKIREEEAEKKKKKHAQERKNREAFRQLLKDKVSNDEFTFKTKWRHFVKRNKENQRLLNMLTQEGTTPREMFHDFREKLLEKNKQIKEEFKKVLTKHFSDFSVDMDPTKFKKILLKQEAFQDFESKGTNSFEYYAEYLFDKYKKRVTKAKKKYLKAIGKEVPDLTKDTTFEEVTSKINSKDGYMAYFSCLTENDRKDILRGVQDRLREGEILTSIIPTTDKKKKTNAKDKDSDDSDAQHPVVKKHHADDSKKGKEDSKPSKDSHQAQQAQTSSPSRGTAGQKIQGEGKESEEKKSGKGDEASNLRKRKPERGDGERSSKEEKKGEDIEEGEIELPKTLSSNAFKKKYRHHTKRRKSSSDSSKSSYSHDK